MLAAYIFGIVLALAVLTLLVVFASLNANANVIVGMSLFGSALVFFYSAKVLHFWAEFKKHHYEELLLRLKDVAFYILVACTYTPIALALPQRGWGWSLFGVAWGISLISAFVRPHILYVYGAYFLMDMVAFSVVHAYLNTSAKWFFGIGGMAYMLATILEKKKQKSSVFPALIGSLAHFWAMLIVVLYL